MRKVLSFVLVLALVLGSFSMAFAATPAGGFSDTDAEAVSVLADLGVIDGYSDGTFKPANVVTRAEMAKLIIVALGLQDFATATTSKYTDMAGAGWAQGYVAYATSLGIIEGYPDGTFGPSNPVTYNEACAMIVRALGYTADFLPGGWPAEWVVKAQTLGILDGVSAAGAAGATRGNIAEMLYNALELEIGYVNKDGDWVANTPADTMLIRLGATFVDADWYAIDDEAMNDAAEAVNFDTDGVIKGDEETAVNLRAFVGAYADIYVSDDDEIIKIVPQSTFLTGDYNATTEEFEADNDVDYNISDDLATDPTNYFYNGEQGTNDTVSGTATDMTIAVDLSGKTIKDVYSISEWVVTEDFMFTEDDADDIADDQELASKTFILDDNDEIDLMEFDLVGVDSLDDIDVDNVVYVYANGGDIRKIEVGTEVVTGDITRISSDDVYTIDGEKYDLADLTGDDSEDVTVGDEVKAYLDVNGDIYSFTLVKSEAANYAVALDYADGTLGLNGDDALVKLFLADGTTEVYEVVSDLMSTEDDTIVTETATTIDWVVIPEIHIVKYGLDKDGVVDVMDVFSNDAAFNTDDYATGAAVNMDISAGGAYNGKYIASNAVIFNADSLTSDDEDDYNILTLADVKDTEGVDAYYVVDRDTNKIIAMVMTGGTTAEDSYGVLTDWATIDTDYDFEVTALIDGDEVTKEATAAVKGYADTAAERMNLYTITYDAAGAFDSVVDVAIDGDTDTSMKAITDAEEDNGNIAGYTLSTDVIIYTWDGTDEVFEAGSKGDIDGTVDVELYDLDGDMIYDIVLVDVVVAS